MSKSNIVGIFLVAVGGMILLGQMNLLPGESVLYILGAGFFLAWGLMGGSKKYGAVGMIIPGSILLAIALFVSLETYFGKNPIFPALFFVLLSMAFLTVYALHTRIAGKEWGEKNWPLFPAAGLGGFSIFLTLILSSQSRENHTLLTVLIAGGLILLGLALILGNQKKAQPDQKK